MFPKKFIPLFAIVLVLAASLVTTPMAKAGSLPCGGNVTVTAGDTLRKIADRCYTTVSALQLANALNNPNLIYVGQVLVMPGALLKGNGVTDIYIVKRGDTLKTLAADFNTTIAGLLSLNPGIANPDLIYEGQRLNVPTPGSTPPAPPATGSVIYVVQSGDTMKKIADRLGITLDTLVQVNPQVSNINLIFAGQRLYLPASISTYTVRRGDTLQKIADRFGTSTGILLGLNPAITNANLIYVGQNIKLK
jgi:LysM repeat protein